MSKLAFADPPYLGRASIWYGNKMRKSQKGNLYGGTGKVQFKAADFHPEAYIWDDLETHKKLIDDLESNYDGFVLCLAHDNLQTLLPLFKQKVKVCIWVKYTIPSRARVQNIYEPVIVKIPKERKGAKKGFTMKDVLKTKRTFTGFTGAKPHEFNIWALNLMGYRPDDELNIMFSGSGSMEKTLESLTNDTK